MRNKKIVRVEREEEGRAPLTVACLEMTPRVIKALWADIRGIKEEDDYGDLIDKAAAFLPELTDLTTEQAMDIGVSDLKAILAGVVEINPDFFGGLRALAEAAVAQGKLPPILRTWFGSSAASSKPATATPGITE